MGQENQRLPLVHVIGTGGSISCIGGSRTDFLDYGYGDRHFTIAEMMARVPEVNDLAVVRLEQFMNAYGGEVSPDRWRPYVDPAFQEYVPKVVQLPGGGDAWLMPGKSQPVFSRLQRHYLKPDVAK